MNPDYPLYCRKANITRRQMIEVLKRQYPKYEKMAQTVVCNPDDYGAQLLPDAEALLVANFGYHEGLSYKPKKKSNRRKANKLTVRLDDTMYARLLRYYSRSSFASMQDFVEAAISNMLDRVEGVA